MSEQPASVLLADHQNGIYLGGLADRLPRLPIAIEALHAAFEATQAPGPRGYVDGGAGTEATMRANRAALDRRRLVPRMLRDVAVREVRRTVLGRQWTAPVGLAPIGVQSIVHPEGELAVAHGEPGRRAVYRKHRVLVHSGGDSGRRGIGAAVVSALLATGPRVGPELSLSRGGRRLQTGRSW